MASDILHNLTAPLSRSLDSQAFTKHRALIGFELEVLAKKLDRFGWDRDRETPAQDRLMTDWMDALQDYPLDEVQQAIRDCLSADPGKMPNEWHVVTKIMEARRRYYASIPKQITVEPPRERPSKELAGEILAQAGYSIRRM
jgi:hypothetical protein